MKRMIVPFRKKNIGFVGNYNSNEDFNDFVKAYDIFLLVKSLKEAINER